MKLTLEEPRILVDSVNVISELVNDVIFKVDKNQIKLVAMDPANVAMVNFTLLSSAFTEYKVDKPVSVAINLDAFKTILRRVKPSDVLTIALDEEKHRLNLQLKSEATRTFNLALIDMEDKEHKIPELTFPVKVETLSYRFDEAVQDMDVVSESVALVAMKDVLFVEAESNLNDAKTELRADGETTIKSPGKDPVKAKYSIEYLKKILKGAKLANKMTIQFNKDYPLKVDYLVKDKLQLSFILAPRVAND